MGRNHVADVPGEMSPMGGIHARAGGEEGASETTCDELTATHMSLCCLGGGGGEFGSEVKPGKKGGVGGRCFKIC